MHFNRHRIDFKKETVRNINLIFHLITINTWSCTTIVKRFTIFYAFFMSILKLVPVLFFDTYFHRIDLNEKKNNANEIKTIDVNNFSLKNPQWSLYVK